MKAKEEQKKNINCMNREFFPLKNNNNNKYTLAINSLLLSLLLIQILEVISTRILMNFHNIIKNKIVFCYYNKIIR